MREKIVKKTIEKTEENSISEALYKKALGYEIEEIVEEYVTDKDF